MLWSPSPPECEECVLWMLRVSRRDVGEVPRCQTPTPEGRDVQTGTAWGCLTPDQIPATEQGVRTLFPSPQKPLSTGLPENPHLQTLEFRGGVTPGQSCGSGPNNHLSPSQPPLLAPGQAPDPQEPIRICPGTSAGTAGSSASLPTLSCRAGGYFRVPDPSRPRQESLPDPDGASKEAAGP